VTVFEACFLVFKPSGLVVWSSNDLALKAVGSIPAIDHDLKSSQLDCHLVLDVNPINTCKSILPDMDTSLFHHHHFRLVVTLLSTMQEPGNRFESVWGQGFRGLKCWHFIICQRRCK
jgi:hypothetical protein